MIQRCLLACSAMLGAALPTAAQTPLPQNVMSSDAGGWYARAADMVRHSDYAGAIDQLRHALNADSYAWSDAAGDRNLRRDAIHLMLKAAFERGDETLFAEYYQPFLNDFGDTAQALEAKLMNADFLFFKKDYPDAVNAYSGLDYSALDPSKQALYDYRLALSLTKCGYFAEAYGIFTNLRSNPSYTDVSAFYLAYIDYVRGDLNKARNGFNSVPTPLSNELGVPYYLAQIDFQQGDFRGVVQRVPSLIQSAPSEWQPELCRITGESYYNLRRPEQAEPYLRRYVNSESAPQFSALYDLGVICYDNREYGEARDCFRRLVNEEDAMGQSANLYMGQIAAREGDYTAAAMAFDVAYNLDIDSKVAETALYDYAVAAIRGGQVPFGSSARMLETFVKKYPNAPYAAQVDEYLATACYNDKDYAGALRHIERLGNPSRANLETKQKILFQLGVQAMGRKNYGEAAGYMRHASSMTSEADKDLAIQASLWQGDALYAMGDYPAATNAYARFVKEGNSRTDNRALGLYNLGYSLYQEKRFGEAAKYFSNALKAMPALTDKLATDCRLRIADCDYYQGNVSGAMAEYAAVAKNTNSSEADYAAFQYANMLGAAGDNSAKAKQLEDMIRLWPDSQWNAEARLELVNAYCATDRINSAADEAASMLKDFPEAPQTRKAAVAVASARQDKDDAAEAIAAYQDIVRRWPTSSEAETAVNSLKTIYTDEGDAQGFISFLNSVPQAPRPDASEMEELAFEAAYNKVRRNKSDLTPLTSYLAQYSNGSNAGRAMLTIASLYGEQGSDSAALSYLNRLLSERPDSESVPAALMLKGQILERQNDYAGAEAVWQQLLAKGGSLYAPEAYAGLIRTTENSSLKLEYADRLLDMTGLGQETIAEATIAKAEALRQMGMYVEAENTLRQLAASPQTEQGAKAAVLLGEILLDSGSPTQAQKELEEFIDSGTSQFYWLARGYITLADAYHAQDDNYKAKEYLRALKGNYPGDEPDIMQMIDSRLSEWK